MKIIEFSSKGSRKENQDFIAYRRMGDEAGIFVVADGMGGYAKGAEAAQVCAEAIVEYLEGHWHDNIDVQPSAIAYLSLSVKFLTLP
ncbi:protein phosphatase 2C domain-containing protein [uncultured Duncaniella sp.]|jgi:protein phosphatase|uniref:protein phosphatase 2C domain-containing protein n=1 Tax=uncultured Duncaniella sp. TaxID=2768039 RepID=UPI0025B26140|nr:protein phosphatase 2C domain-containing protein [uncultured Duncaniella sp.]